MHNLMPTRLATRLRGVIAGFALAASGKVDRRPVSAATYRLSREMKRRGAISLKELERVLPTPIPRVHPNAAPA
jgi:hypothetical protein